MPIRIASCSCGQLTAQVEGEPVRVSICHCLACQRRTGSPFGEQARFALKHTVIAGTFDRIRADRRRGHQDQVSLLSNMRVDRLLRT